jgi:hypothetical protein
MLQQLMNVEQSVSVQATIALGFALVWWAFFMTFKPMIGAWCAKQKWWGSCAKLMEKMFNNYGIFKEMYPSEEAWQFGLCDMYANIICIIAQHALGGLLCIPAVFGLAPASWNVVALARLGGLCEVGWEIYDLGMNWWVGVPDTLMMVMVIHHACAQLMVVPSNLLLENSANYFAQVLNLQGAAVAACTIDAYVKTLDFSKKSDVKTAFYGSALAAFILGFTRGVIFPVLGFKIFLDIYAEGQTFLFFCACGSTITMSFFNYLMIQDAFSRCKKFYELAYGSTVAPATEEAEKDTFVISDAEADDEESESDAEDLVEEGEGQIAPGLVRTMTRPRRGRDSVTPFPSTPVPASQVPPISERKFFSQSSSLALVARFSM